MEKILVFEQTNVIQSLEEVVNENLSNLNSIQRSFEELQPFRKIESEEEAFKLVKNPLEFYDQIMISGVGLTPVAGHKPDPAAIAQMYGMKRKEYINALSLPVPGSTKNLAPYALKGNDKMFQWDKTFSIVPEELEKHLDQYRTYATTKAHHELLKYWKDYAQTQNKHLASRYIRGDQVYAVSHLTGLKDIEGRFEPDYKMIAQLIRNMN